MGKKHNIISKAAAISAVALSSLEGGAMPALPRTIMIDDGKGGMIEVAVTGDEYHHSLVSPDMQTLFRRDSDGKIKADGKFDRTAFYRTADVARTKRNLKSSPTFPCYGQQRAVAILVEFPSTDAHPEGRKFRSEDPCALFSEMLNSDGYAHDGATGSVRNYFLDSSNGTFDLTFDVFGPVTLSHDVAYFCDGAHGDQLNSWEMVEEACRSVDSEVDFTNYDRDHDGIIDNVYIFYAGPGAATGGDPTDCIWQHASDVELLSGKQFTFDGVRLNHYACSNEYRDVRDPATGTTSRLTEGIGTVCHEFSHVLGLPDLYDVFGYGSTSPGVWDVMDMGCHLNESRTPAAYSALDRMLLGWMTPDDIGSSPATLSLPQISTNKAYRIPTADENEFFILENRQQTGWDSALPGHGMIVWRINYQKDYWDSNQVNTGKGRSHAYIIPADGYYGASSYPGDPFPGASNIRDLSDDGYPNMLTSRGERTNAPISSVVEAGGVITFDICKAVTSLERAEGLRVSDLTPHSFTAEWNPLPLCAGYELSVYDRSGIPTGIYDHLNVASTSVRVEGLEPLTEYTFTVRGVAGAVKGEESEPFSVTTPEMAFEFMSPQGVTASQADATSCRVTWLPMDEAVDYSLHVFTTTAGPERMAVADFTGGIESLPGGWSTNAISTMSMSGYYGEAAPALSLTTDYGRLQTPMLTRPLKTLSFWYRERSASGKSTVSVEFLTDGEWIAAHTIALPKTSTAGTICLLEGDLIPEGSYAARIIYHRAEKGTLVIDDVRVTYLGEEELTAVDGYDGLRLGEAVTTVLIGDLEVDTDYVVRVRGINAEGIFSALSEAVTVRLDADTGVESPDMDEDTTLRLYDMQGRSVTPGQVVPGIYILKGNAGTRKIHITHQQ